MASDAQRRRIPLGCSLSKGRGVFFSSSFLSLPLQLPTRLRQLRVMLPVCVGLFQLLFMFVAAEGQCHGIAGGNRTGPILRT